MKKYGTVTLEILDSVAQKNTTNAANSIKTSYNQAGRFADTLAKGILLDHSNGMQ